MRIGEFSLGVTWRDGIRNKCTKGTAQAEWLEVKLKRQG